MARLRVAAAGSDDPPWRAGRRPAQPGTHSITWGGWCGAAGARITAGPAAAGRSRSWRWRPAGPRTRCAGRPPAAAPGLRRGGGASGLVGRSGWGRGCELNNSPVSRLLPAAARCCPLLPIRSPTIRPPPNLPDSCQPAHPPSALSAARCAASAASTLSVSRAESSAACIFASSLATTCGRAGSRASNDAQDWGQASNDAWDWGQQGPAK